MHLPAREVLDGRGVDKLVVMIIICRQWVKALQVYLNYDQYEDTYLERPSTKPQGIAHVISSATSFTKKGETIY